MLPPFSRHQALRRLGAVEGRQVATALDKGEAGGHLLGLRVRGDVLYWAVQDTRRLGAVV